MNSNKIRIVILLISLLQMGTNAISAILGDIAQAFPEAAGTSIQLLMTFPSLFVLVFALLSPMIAARITRRNTILIGCSMFAMSGILSFMMHASLQILYLWAALMGIGIGLVVPMATGSVAEYFEGNEQRVLMGWQSSAANIGAMTMTFVGGLLAGIHWSYNYLVYLIILPGLVMTWLFYPKEKSAAKTELPFGLLTIRQVRRCALLAASTTLLFNMVPTNISMLIQQNEIGSNAQAGFAATLLLMAGTLMGIFFGKISAKLGRYVITFGQGLLLAGMFILSKAETLPMVFAGCLTAGGAISAIMPMCMLDSSKASGRGAASGALQMAASNLGAFLSPFITNAAVRITGSYLVADRFTTGMYITAVIMIVTWIILHRMQAAERS